MRDESANEDDRAEQAASGAELAPEELIRHFDRHLTDRQRRWIEGSGGIRRPLGRLAFELNRRVMRGLFSVELVERIALDLDAGPVIFAPNHSSSLDSLVLASVLDWDDFARTRFAVRRGVVTTGRLRRGSARLAGVVPIRRDRTALAVAAAILAEGRHLVWYPEGTRTRTGEVGPFKPGLGLLLEHCEAVALPVHLDGVFEAMPPDRLLPRRRPIRVRFGAPVRRRDFEAAGLEASARIDAMVERVREGVLSLAARARAGAGRG